MSDTAWDDFSVRSDLHVRRSEEGGRGNANEEPHRNKEGSAEDVGPWDESGLNGCNEDGEGEQETASNLEEGSVYIAKAERVEDCVNRIVSGGVKQNELVSGRLGWLERESWE